MDHKDNQFDISTGPFSCLYPLGIKKEDTFKPKTPKFSTKYDPKEIKLMRRKHIFDLLFISKFIDCSSHLSFAAAMSEGYKSIGGRKREMSLLYESHGIHKMRLLEHELMRRHEEQMTNMVSK